MGVLLPESSAASNTAWPPARTDEEQSSIESVLHGKIPTEKRGTDCQLRDQTEEI
jgi:hypothetical protein